MKRNSKAWVSVAAAAVAAAALVLFFWPQRTDPEAVIPSQYQALNAAVIAPTSPRDPTEQVPRDSTLPARAASRADAERAELAASNAEGKKVAGTTRRAASDGPTVQGFQPVATEAAGNARDEGPLVAQYRREENAILRREALQQWDTDNRNGAVEVARSAVADADPTVILKALAILERRGDKASASLLSGVIHDNLRRPDGYGMPIREAAIRALGQCGDVSSITALVTELERHEDLSYDNAVVQALAQIGHASALDALERQIQRLGTFKPTESIAQEPLKQAMELTVAARDKLAEGGAR